jgi:RNA polymerase sigma factor (sigma-70 family)
LWLVGRWGKAKRRELVEEIVSAAWLGLVKAARKHDPARGEFRAFAASYVRWHAHGAAFGGDVSQSQREIARRSLPIDKPLGQGKSSWANKLEARGPDPCERAAILERVRSVLDVAGPDERRALALISKGLTISDAARDAGVSRQTVSNWLARLRSRSESTSTVPTSPAQYHRRRC